jgi:hypothetical protein
MAVSMSTKGGDTPAGRAMMDAIELSLQGRSPYPKRARFLDAGLPDEEEAIAHALDRGYAVVLVWEDGSTRILHPEPRPDAPPAAA